MQIHDEVLTWAIGETRAWIEEQRTIHRPAGGQLPPVAKDAVRGFFTPAVLDSARVAVLAGIPNPPFLEQARAGGLPVQVDFSIMEGLTPLDTIRISPAVPPTEPPSLVFRQLLPVGP